MAVSRIKTAFPAVRIRTVILVVMDRSDAEIEQRLCRIGKKAAAKRSATRRFHALYGKVCRWDILVRAWELVKANRGAAGMYGETILDIEEQGLEALLIQLQGELREGRYRPRPVRRV